MIGFLCGYGACILTVLTYLALAEWRVRRHKLRGNYFDARSPFRIVSRGPAPIQERSEELIARTARRAMRRHESR